MQDALSKTKQVLRSIALLQIQILLYSKYFTKPTINKHNSSIFHNRNLICLFQMFPNDFYALNFKDTSQLNEVVKASYLILTRRTR